jgi:hypothetical protein
MFLDNGYSYSKRSSSALRSRSPLEFWVDLLICLVSPVHKISGTVFASEYGGGLSCPE